MTDGPARLRLARDVVRGVRPAPFARLAGPEGHALPVRVSLFATASGVPHATSVGRRAARPGPEVDDPVGRANDVEVVLDDDDARPFVDEGVSARRRTRVLRVQPGARLVDDEERPLASSTARARA
jgi:hypothetical protein